jgi:uncharacterized integral membrane protein
MSVIISCFIAMYIVMVMIMWARDGNRATIYSGGIFYFPVIMTLISFIIGVCLVTCSISNESFYR